MVHLKILKSDRKFILRLSIYGAAAGFIYSFFENYFKGTSLLPLMLRATVFCFLLLGSLGLFDLLSKDFLRKKSFFQILGIKSAIYLAIIAFWLLIINGINEAVNNNVSFLEGIGYYYKYSGMVAINIATIIFIIVSINASVQINSLHRKGELISFILGRYRRPIEKSRIFLFIDLKSSTAIAEKLGHIKFGLFLQEYYFDMAKAARISNGEIYDYVGDEAIISWTMDKKDSLKNCLMCIDQLKVMLDNGKDRYLRNYGIEPAFRAGAHGGKSVVMWVGEDRKEILYLGDVLNTAKRIQNECDRFSAGFLISGDLIKSFPGHNESRFLFMDKLFLKGKEQEVELYSVL